MIRDDELYELVTEGRAAHINATMKHISNIIDRLEAIINED